MVELPAAGKRVAKRVGIAQVAMHVFDGQAVEVGQFAVLPDQHADVCARCDDRAGYGGPHKARGAGDEDFHRCSVPRSAVSDRLAQVRWAGETVPTVHGCLLTCCISFFGS